MKGYNDGYLFYSVSWCEGPVTNYNNLLYKKPT